MNKGWGMLSAAVLAAGALTGCGSEGDATPDLSDDEAVALIRDLPSYESFDTTALDDLAQGTCDLFEAKPAGMTDREVRVQFVDRVTENGSVTAEDASAFVTYASSWKCPEHYESSSLTG